MSLKKIAAVLIIALLIIIYTIMVMLAIFTSVLSKAGLFIGLIITVFIVGMIIYVSKERIEEIKGGEEDDLSKY